ncbi:FMN-binding glutamate synthase family protein [Sulfuriroseicoccus oceanibius]|uniref:FMN-binding glutamate synthase family protein n=1 Tax=Sulfuriroseicoccus oceanibius TaxID=2707525 RepID=A0A6B3L9A7_9BACT|nr:FMN-binding glutamate synthase family protein [Sulfuriroseicoccus oceanibius]QQL45064.1 FMN-binding glutamate synthase family protein [Sulfuriroseicoccus oceanibius]
MSKTLHVNLHRLAVATNIGLVVMLGVAILLGITVSGYFHILTVVLLLLNALNFYYRRVQQDHTILRNFGILGQSRYLIESLGPELRQYLIANDTEERPFNRNERAQVYSKAKNLDSTASFGSLLNFDNSEIKIRHSMFPSSLDGLTPFSVTFGEARGVAHPYTIRKPIMISAMSYGALGCNAVRALARGAHMAGIPMNTGEGGFPKYHLMEEADLIFQLGTAKYGARRDDGTLDPAKLKAIAAEPQVKMIEIKFSQGAKPGKGGLLPKEKITAEIAELRGIPRDRDAISPRHHAECTDIPSTVAFIGYIQSLVDIPVGIKLCIGSIVEFRQLVLEMKQQNTVPDWITIDGSEGGTGAAPRAFMDRVGVPLYPALHQVHRILTEERLRDRTRLIASGKLVVPSRQFIAFTLGADAIFTARGFLLALGCIQALQCSSNTCPTGITTHAPNLQHGIVPAAKAPRIQNYVDNTVHDLEELLAASGKTCLSQLSINDLYIPSDASIAPFLDQTATSR